jgi:hypothetical protein
MDPNMYITVSQLSVGLLRNETANKHDGIAANKHIRTRFYYYHNPYKTGSTKNENVRVYTVSHRI